MVEPLVSCIDSVEASCAEWKSISAPLNEGEKICLLKWITTLPAFKSTSKCCIWAENDAFCVTIVCTIWSAIS